MNNFMFQVVFVTFSVRNLKSSTNIHAFLLLLVITVQKALVTKYIKIFFVKLAKSSPTRMQIKFAQTYSLKRIVRLNVLFAQTYCSLKRIVPGIPLQTRLNIDFDAPTIGGGSRNSGKEVHILLQNNVFK